MTAGQQMVLLPSAAWPLTYHATTMNINGGVSYTCAAGDRIYAVKDLANVIRVSVTKQDGTSVVSAGGGGLIFLGEVIPTVSATLSFLNIFSSTYDNYFVIGCGILPAVDSSGTMKWANSGSIDTGSNYARVDGTNTDSGSATFTSTSWEAPIRLTVEATSGLGANFQMTIRNVNQASQIKDFVSHSGGQNSTDPNTFQSYETRGGYKGGVVSGFELSFDGNNFVAQGYVRVYGIVNS